VPAVAGSGETVLLCIQTSAIGSTVTVSVASLLSRSGSPITVESTLAVFTRSPSNKGRETSMVMVAVWPDGMVPLSQVTVPFKWLQLNP